MKKNTIKITILNTDYAIITEENGEYVCDLAKRVEENIEQVMLNNSNISSMSAAILTSLDYCDKITKSITTLEELYYQVEKYKSLAEDTQQKLNKANKQIENSKKSNR